MPVPSGTAALDTTVHLAEVAFLNMLSASSCLACSGVSHAMPGVCCNRDVLACLSHSYSSYTIRLKWRCCLWFLRLFLLVFLFLLLFLLIFIYMFAAVAFVVVLLFRTVSWAAALCVLFFEHLSLHVVSVFVVSLLFLSSG